MEVNFVKNIVILFRIAVQMNLLSQLQVGGVFAPSTDCYMWRVKQLLLQPPMDILGGFTLTVNLLVLVPQTKLATNTLIDGQVVTVESFTTTSTGGCSSMSPGITMSVGVNPDVFLTSTAYASSPSSSTFCEGEAITFTASSTSAIATYTFMVGRLFSKKSNSNTYTTGTPLSSTVSVSVRVQTAAGCIATDTLDLFYNDIDVKGTIGQVSSTICPNEIPPAFTNVASATATFGTISYRWQTRTSGTNFENTIPLVTTEVYTPTTGLTTTTFFRRVAESTYGGKLCEEYSNIIQIAVDESPVSQLQVGEFMLHDTDCCMWK